MKVNKEIKSNSMKKSKKQNNPNFDEFIRKVDVERFDYNNLLQDFKFMKRVVKTTMDFFLLQFHRTSFAILTTLFKKSY